MNLLRHLITATFTLILGLLIWRLMTDESSHLHAPNVIRLLAILVCASALHSHISRA
jgi:hypothetical protein